MLTKKSLSNVLQDKVSVSDRGFTVIDDEQKEKFISYQDLFTTSQKVLFNLQMQGFKKGDEVLFQVEREEDFIYFSWACILGGMVSVPLSCNNTHENVMQVSRVWKILQKPKLISTKEQLRSIIHILNDENCHDIADEIKQNTLLDKDILLDKGIGEIACADINDTAFVVFSSGSTGEPKGIVLTNEKILCAIESMSSHLDINSSDVFLNWMPLTHVIGLVLFHVLPVAYDINHVVMSKSLFIKNPVLWLQKADQYKATIMISPNIGFRQFLNCFDSNTINMNLSHVRTIMVSAEPISGDLSEQFMTVLSKFGLRNKVLSNLYGMSESCLGITCTLPSEDMKYNCLNRNFLAVGDKIKHGQPGDEDCSIFVNSGTPIKDCFVRISDDIGNILGDDCIGHVQVTGKNIINNYYTEEATARSFTSDGWLITGDIGFLENGYLTITGRAKDMIIVNGQNFYVNDIERVAEGIEQIEFGKVAACGIFDSQSQSEKAVLFIENKKPVDEFIPLLLKIKNELSYKMGIEISKVIPVKEIPKTASGKIQRYKLAKEYANGIYNEIHENLEVLIHKHLSKNIGSEPQSYLQEKLLNICREVLHYQNIGIDDNLFDYGLHSITMAGIVAKVNNILNYDLNFADFISNQSVRELEKVILEKSNKKINELYPECISNPKEMYEPFPLTGIQEAYLIGRNEDIEMGGVCTHFYQEIETEYEISLLNICLEKLIKAYPMMRAVITKAKSQKILKEVPEYKIQEVDLRHLNEAEQQQAICSEREIMSHYVFETDKWPLFEFKSFKLTDNRNYLFVSYDLIIADAASVLNIGKSLVDLYKSPDTKICTPEFSFRDYVISYNDFKESDIYKRDHDFWQKKIADFPDSPALAYKTSPENIKKPRYERIGKRFSSNKWSKIKSIAQGKRITASSLLCTTFMQVLSNWSNQKDFAISLTSFNALPFHKDVSSILGDFTSVLPLEVHFDSNNSLWDRCIKVQNEVMELLEHRNYDGVDVIRDIARYKNIGIGKAVLPIVFSSILFEEGRFGWSEIGEIKFSASQTPQVFIDVQVMEDNGELSVTWDYAEQLFDKTIIEKMFEQYVWMLEEIVQGEESHCLTIGEEEQKLVQEYNSTSQAIPEKTLHGIFVEQVSENPENVAVIYENESITYEELDKKSNQIAKYLNEHGVIRGDYIGVLAYRRIETIVNILGILKAGAAYIPLNPDHPEDRRDYILQNAGAKMQLVPETYEEKEIYKYDDRKLENNIHPDDIAYVIYTSGSTGRPKGVVIKHKAAANTIIDINNKFNVNEEDRFIGLSSMCFDLSVYDIFGALSSGAALVMINDQRDVKNINEIIEKHGITIWNSVPAIIDMLLDSMGIGDEVEIDYRQSSYGNEVAVDYSNYSDSDSLRLVLLSGDWIALTLPEKIKNQFSNAEVISLGGATEASIWSIYYPIEEVKSTWKSIPYGMPLSNQSFYVLNYENQICHIGVMGELCIGGLGLAEGYLNDEEKTTQSFISHPELGRLYKTGDYGVLHKEGYIEFFGRKDQQIKINGYRLELGEIENCILQYNGVRNTVVIDRAHDNGRKYLCAYIVGEKEISIPELREYIGELLPDYMVPSYFVMVDEIPLTANGKVNRKELPEPEVSIETEEEYAAPTNEIEAKLTAMWQDLLEVDQISINNNFFELGGNSVMMVQIITKIDKEIGVEINFREFLKENTISKLARLILSKGVSTIGKVVYPEIIPDIERVNEPFPLTGIQMAYLMGRDDKFELGGVSTHVYIEYETKLEAERFNKSINKVISRHPMLRAVILPSGQQKILDEIPEYKMEIVDLRHMDSKDQEVYILKEREEKSHQVFKTDKWPLFEFKMFRITDETNYLFFGLDMLIADGASILMIFNQIMKHYENPELNVPEIKCTFRDYMLAYNDFKKSEVYKKDKEYWIKQLDSFPQAPVLPYKTDPSNVGEPHFDRCYKAFNREEWNQIKRKAQESSITPAAVLCTAYAQVLGYWSNQDSVAINSTVFNRYPFHEDVNRIIGDFTSVMLLGIDLKIGSTFWEKAKYVQDVFAEALEHRHYDGIEFIRDLTKYHNLGNKAVMPIVFTSMLFGNSVDVAESGTNAFGNVKMSVSQTSQVFIDQQIIEVDGGVTITWDYVDQLFDKEMMNNMFEQYIGILEEVASRNENYCLTIKEKDQKLLDEYNSTSEAIPEKTLHGMFVEQTAENGENIAVIYEDETITYEELDKKSNQIAKYLNEQGVIRGDYVGVLAYRKIETIVNILGVLKAGAAYIPLNPDHPEDRRNYILENASAKMQLLPETYVEKEISKYDIKKLENNIYPDDIAYVIYTSGSTGKPKGVMVKHKAAANTIIDINNKFNVNEEDRVIGLSSMCFDLSVYDIFGALSSGAALVMINDQRDIKNINDVIKKHDISIWNSVPAIMDMLLDNIGIYDETEVDYRQSSYGNEVAVDYSSYSDNDSLRLVLLSGDWIPLTLPEKIQDKFSNAEVISLGGATEASIWSIYYPVEEVQMDWKSIPYGIPLANQKFYVLNYNKDICPVEVIGELYIGGDGLAEGYMNDEEKTNNAFINHPDLGRLYNTGDYGVLHREGYIEFFGRKDQQIKIRGYRVELGEIQSGILEYKGIKNAVVVDRTHENGRKYLCAYIVGEKEVSITGVREYLEELLPDYMVPSYFVMVDEIPLTANGKVDRKALPEPDGNVELGTAYAAPTNEMENKLAVIWQSLLGLDQVGINDGFFELGGNSVMMVQMITKIDREIGVEINFREFLEKNTIAKLAGLISSRYTSNESASSTVKIVYPEIVPDKEKMYEPFPLTGIQMAYLMGRDDKFELGGVSTHVYTEYETKLEEERFNNSINKIISRHPMMRAVILSNGQQKILDKVPEYKMEVVDLRQLDSKDQEKYILEERKQKSHHVFKTDEWPLFEFKMLKLTDETNYLFFGLDMLIADGASILMIIHEIMKYYDDPKLNLPEINCTFRDYMLAYNDFKNGEVYKKDKEYWLQQLDSFPQAPVLPYKTDPSNIGQPRFDRCYKAFNSNEWNKIKGKVQENGITPAAALCTAYAEVLGYWSNQDRVAINSTIFNRYPFHREVNSIIGDFTSVMLLGIDLKIGSTFFEKAKYVQNVFAEALEHRHYDGVEFIGELSKYHNIGNKAAMPIVFTSMLFGNTVDIGESATNTFGDVKMSVSQTSQVFIDQQIIEVDGGISITWDYVEQLFEKDLIENMFEQYIGILESIIEEKEYRLEAKSSDLAVINEYNATEQEIGKETLHGLFIKQAEKTPNNIAVMFEENTLTYKELDEKSNQVANFLREKNIGRNDYVGVIAERCIESIVNILGVLKAGAAYVPINPEHPEDRRKYILENSNCKMELLPDSYKRDNIAGCSNERIYTKEYPEDMAYVIYTSGSTGKPKGVIIKHEAAANTIIDINQKFDVNEEDRIIGLSSMCFDLSVYDIFGALSSGAALVMIEDQRDVKNIQKVIDNNGITIWNSVPAIMDMLIDNISEDGDSDEVDYWNSHNSGNLVEYNANESLRVVLLSGDWIPLTLPEKIKDKFADAEVVSLGGATEASIWSIYYPIDEVNEEWSSIPYGMPLANQKFYVLNYEKEVCPIGIAGELYISGEGLAEGYMNDDEKTNNAFINHPDLGRLYNTGDYGVMHREGYIEFLGRKDHQIKIRGYRVELGEIENRILEHQSIKNVVVIDRSHSNGRKYLCAYLVSDVDISVGELREHLGKTVPDYMIPSYFVILDKIPLTANGKVDRKALPEPEVDSLETGVEYVAPNSGIEAKLAEIWQELLEVEQVGINDNFFELGGNSVLLVKMHKQLEQEYPNKIKIVDVFSHPTIAKLAQLIEKVQEKKRDLPMYPLQMPVEFFTVDSDLDNQFYQLSIEGRVFEKLELISKNENVSKYDILFALYSNLIAQITENNEIEIETLFRENFVYSLGLSVEKVADFSELLKIIKEKMSQIEPKRLFEVKDLNSYQGKKQAMSSALLLFYDNSLLTEQINLVDFYDLILEVEENESNMIISCSYNSLKINSKKVGELVSQYNQIIELLVENY